MKKINGKRFVLKPVLITGLEFGILYVRTETHDLARIPVKWVDRDSPVKKPGQKGKLVVIIPEGKEIVWELES